MNIPPNFQKQFGYILTSINKPESLTTEELMRQKAVEWHGNLLQSISYAYASAVKINMQFISLKRKPVQFRLIFSISDEVQNVIKLIAEIKKDLSPLFSSVPVEDHDPYLFRELSETELSEEFPLSGEKITYTLFSRKPVKLSQANQMGFSSNKQQKDKTERQIQELFPVDPNWFGDEEFLKAMFLRQDDAIVEVELLPRILTNDEIKAIKSAIRKPSLLSGSLTEEETGPYIQTLKRIISTKDDKFLVSVILKTTGDSPEQYLKSAIHRYFFGGKAKIGHQLVDESTFNQRMTGKSGQHDVSFIYTYDNVCQPFRFPLPSQDDVPGLNIQSFSFHQVPANLPEEGLLMGYKIFGNIKKSIRINEHSLSRHLYIMGQTGTGKSTMLKSMINDCIKKGFGFTVIDPHGDLFNDILNILPSADKDRIKVLDPINSDTSIGVNPLYYDKENPASKSLVINELKRCVVSLYSSVTEAFGPAFEAHFINGMQLILNDAVQQKYGELGLREFTRIYKDNYFRDSLLSVCDDSSVKMFYESATIMHGEQAFENWALYITAKLTRFVDDYYLGPILGRNHNSLNFRDVIDNGQILLVRMDKGKMGIDNTSLLGQLVLSNLFMAGMSRTDMCKDGRKPYYIFVDEFQNFMRGDVGNALSEMRKYKLSLILANQTLGQLDRYMVDSLLGNAGNMIFFRPGINDYSTIAHYFEPEFNRQEVLKLPNFNCIGRLLIDNIPSDPFVFQTEQI